LTTKGDDGISKGLFIALMVIGGIILVPIAGFLIFLLG